MNMYYTSVLSLQPKYSVADDNSNRILNLPCPIADLSERDKKDLDAYFFSRPGLTQNEHSVMF